jgi:serine protease AprX
MGERRFVRLALVLALVFSTLAVPALAQTDHDQNVPEIRLRSGAVHRDSLRLDEAQLDRDGRGSYLVAFSGPIAQSQADALRAMGAELTAYIPDFAYKAILTPAQAGSATQVNGVVAVTVFQPELKLSPDLQESGLYRIRLERGSDQAAARANIAAVGGSVLTSSGDVLTVVANRRQLDALARINAVAWVENLMFREKHNEYGAGVILGANVANTAGYDGSSQIVAVADTGIGGGTASSAHTGIPASRIVDIFDWPGVSAKGCYNVSPDGSVDVDSGHGTHTAVSVLGGGDTSGVGKGTAPAAKLVFQSTEDYARFRGLCAVNPNGYYLLGLPDDLKDLLQQAYDAGALIHSDSWGSDAAGDYTVDSAQVDDFMWLNQDFLMTTSAGNAGVDASRDGYVDQDSMGSPATAKNTLTVGASENDRGGDLSCDTGLSNGCGGQNNIFTYGEAWPDDYPKLPLSGDPSAGNAEQMAAFSSRGPTDDGRIKPDVVAPGTWVLSGYSDLYQEGYDGSTNPRNGAYQYDGWGFPASEGYKYMGGTSMSNPLAAGAAAVVRDYYVKAHGHHASAALTKASLINSAVDLLDENNDGTNDNAFPIPNNHEGWGRIDLARSVDGTAEFIDDGTGLTTSASKVYTFEVDGSADFKATLVWSDYPSTEVAAVNLVNDLDLTVTAPDNATYAGNVFSGGWSTTGGSADRRNNVENVYVASPVSGTWTVTVSGYNVPFDRQPFGLVVDSGVATGGDNVDPVASFTSSCTDLDCTFTDTSTDSDGNLVAWAWDFGDGSTSTAKNPAHSYAGVGTYTVDLTVSDDGGATDTTTAPVAVTAPTLNADPVASFTSSCTDLNCTFTDTSEDIDGTVEAWAWDFGDGVASLLQNPNHTYGAAGAYSITLTVTDNDNATDTASAQVAVADPVGGATMHVADLDGENVSTGRTWMAVVTVTVVDGGGNGVSSATVRGVWKDGTSGVCTTDGAGICSVELGDLRRKSITFTVNSITHASLTYDPGSNTDADGDSSGTVITVNRP